MAVEIERKFLVDHEQWKKLPKPAGAVFKQGYILNDDSRMIRVRITDDQAYITFKGAASGISRSEHEYAIPVQDGIELFNLFAKTSVEKTRYCMEFENKLWEVDVFDGDNKGLIVAEIELEYEDEQFALPHWVTAEVTAQQKYYNSSLSVYPFLQWP